MNRPIVVAEWQRAVESLRAAETLAREGFRADAVSRAYYAILHWTKAVLQVDDVVVENHAGTRRMWGAAQEAQAECDRARAFLERMRGYLLQKGLAMEELNPRAAHA